MIKIPKENQKLKIILCFSLFMSAFFACSENPPTRSGATKMVPVALRVSLEQSPRLDTISSLVLTVTADDMETVRETITIHNNSFADTLSVPAGTAVRHFVLEAKNSSGRTLYKGSASAKVAAGTTTTINITLVPAVLMIKMTPRYQSVHKDESFNLSVGVYNVDSLFGASFRIEFDNSRLRYIGTNLPSPPGILGPQDAVIFFDTSGSDYVAVAITKKYPAIPESGSGALAQLQFRAISTGTAKLTFAQKTLSLVDQDGKKIPGFDSLVMDEATVEIQHITADVIVPLTVGNYWVFSVLNPDGTPSEVTSTLGITGSSIVTYEDHEYFVYYWNWFDDFGYPSDDFYLMSNQNDGMWLIGYAWNSFDSVAYFPNLLLKYPANVGDTWEYYELAGWDTVQCVSTSSMIETFAGTFECYVYHHSFEEFYSYFSPGIGYVGNGYTIDGQDTEGYRLINYHLESGSPTAPHKTIVRNHTTTQAYKKTWQDARSSWCRPYRP